MLQLAGNCSKTKSFREGYLALPEQVQVEAGQG